MTARDRRALVLGAVAIAGAVAVLRVITAAARQYDALRTRVAEREATLLRARAMVAARRAVEDSLDRAARDLVALAPGLLSGSSAADAAAALSARMTLIAELNDARVEVIDPRPDTGSGLFVPVEVRADLETDLAGLAGILRAVESEQPTLTVRALSVRRAEPMGSGGRGGGDVLRVSLEVVGWRIRREVT